jgi:chitin disaccharide deacetylase
MRLQPTKPNFKKQLIIHCDDLGMAHSINQAAFRALEEGAISSGSAMANCPWFAEVADYAREHSNLDLGLHLVLTSEWARYRWRPMAPSGSVPSLIDAQGYLWPDTATVMQRAKAAEVAIELEAQMQHALQCGFKPTHVDSHMFALLGRLDLFSTYVEFARRHGLPFFVPGKANMAPNILDSLQDQDIILTAYFTATATWLPERWFAHYAVAVGDLKPGLNEVIVHLAVDDTEMRSITGGKTAWGSAWRQRDLNVTTSQEFRALLTQAGMEIVNWLDLRELPAPRRPFKDE